MAQTASQKAHKQNQWQRGADLVGSLLSPAHASHAGLSDSDKEGMREIQRLLESRSVAVNCIPQELSAKPSRDGDDGGVLEFVAMEFGGLRHAASFKTTAKNVRHALVLAETCKENAETGALYRQHRGSVEENSKLYLPREWFGLSPERQRRVYRLLDINDLARWGYNGIELEEACEGNSLLFVGWAILAAPHAQKAMAESLGPEMQGLYRQQSSAILERELEQDCDDSAPARTVYSYDFMSEFEVKPETLCNFLRTVEATYRRENRYHNNMHAADALQTTFSLLKMGADHYADNMLEIYGLLVAAACHDMHHPGRNNTYQIHAHTDLAVDHNNRSVLENMHSAAAIRLLKQASEETGETKDADRINILAGFQPQQVATFRSIVVESILATDMSTHFASMAALKGKVAEAAEASCEEAPDPDDIKQSFTDEQQPVSHALIFFLHAADVSNAAKPAPIFSFWAERVLDEFFAQGDQEKREGLVVSPMCDRDGTELCDSQIGFLKYVVRPMYDLVGVMVPGSKAEISRVLDENLSYWEERKQERAVQVDEPQSKEES